MLSLPNALLVALLVAEDALPVLPARIELAARLAWLRVRRALIPSAEERRRLATEARLEWARVNERLVATGDPRLRAAWWWGVVRMHALGVE
jgi:hypothetical protein